MDVRYNAMVVACLLASCSGASHRVTADVVVGDSAGVRVVRVAPLASLRLPEWHATKVFSTKNIGGRELPLFVVTYGLFLPDSDLVLANSGSSELLLIDASGGGVRHVGRKGKGPGEFEWPGRLIPAEDGGFFAWDARLLRLSRLDAAGGYVASQLVPSGEPLTVLDDGRILALLPEHRWFPSNGEYRDTVPLLLYAPRRGVDTLGLWPGLEKHLAHSHSGALMMPVGFGRSVEYASNGSRTVIATNDSLDLTAYSGSVVPVLHLVAPPDPRRPGQAQKVAWREQVVDAVDRTSQGVDPNARAAFVADYRKALDRDPMRDSYPGFDGLAMDAAGRLWIGAYPEPGAPTRRWIVFDVKGNPIGQIHLPLRFMWEGNSTELLAVATDRFAILHLDSLGTPTVEVWRLGSGS